jgi:plasmid stabilization system protein ParE
MFIVWHEEAQSEADAAAEFYQQKQSGLEKCFLDNLEDAISKITRRPYLYRQIEANIRKCKLSHFPYTVIYRIQADAIQIIAVMHLRQEPGYWKYRI